MSLAQAEVDCLNNIGLHDNVIGIVDSGRALYHDLSGNKRSVNFIVLELATGGELFDLIVKSGCFDETMARHYFK